MARGEWVYQGRGKWNCSYKKTTLIICLINTVFALYVLRSLYGSIYVYSNSGLNNGKINGFCLLFCLIDSVFRSIMAEILFGFG